MILSKIKSNSSPYAVAKKNNIFFINFFFFFYKFKKYFLVLFHCFSIRKTRTFSKSRIIKSHHIIAETLEEIYIIVIVRKIATISVKIKNSFLTFFINKNSIYIFFFSEGNIYFFKIKRSFSSCFFSY